jgi:hypothetical protein
MTPSRGDHLAEDYLARLGQAARGLPAHRQIELVAQVREHIASARAEAAEQQGGSDEVVVRNALDDLGPPEDIVAAAAADLPGATGLRPGGRSTGQQWYDLVTVLLLLLGGVVVPMVGWLAGVVLLWASRRWSIRDKLLGTLVVPLGLAAPLYIWFNTAPFAALTTSESCYATGDGGVVCETGPRPAWVRVTLLVVLTVAPLVMAVVLLLRAGRADRPSRAEPHPDSVTGSSNST